MKYVDGFVIVVPKKNLEEYKKMAEDAGKIWMKHGALQYIETVGEDLIHNMDGQEMWSFPKMTHLKEDELVIFSFIVYKSKAHRDEVNEKVMKDPNMADPNAPMPYDTKRFAYGGFETIVDL